MSPDHITALHFHFHCNFFPSQIYTGKRAANSKCTYHHNWICFCVLFVDSHFVSRTFRFHPLSIKLIAPICLGARAVEASADWSSLPARLHLFSTPIFLARSISPARIASSLSSITKLPNLNIPISIRAALRWPLLWYLTRPHSHLFAEIAVPRLRLYGDAMKLALCCAMPVACS